MRIADALGPDPIFRQSPSSGKAMSNKPGGQSPMAYNRYHKDRIGNHQRKPETLMLGYGYDPTLSEGAVKPPVFLTSTFVFNSAEHGKEFFDYVAGRRE